MKKYVEVEAVGELMVRTISPILTAEQIHAEYEKELASRKEKESKCPICWGEMDFDKDSESFSHGLYGECPLTGRFFRKKKWLIFIELWENRK